MDRVAQLAETLLNRAESEVATSDMALAVEKAAAALRLRADVAKLQAELTKLSEEATKTRRENLMAPRKERSERLRDYAAMLTPVITIVTLAATLIAQNWQFLQSETSKREAAIEAQWQEAIKTISSSGAISPGVVALQPYLRSDKYSEQARDVAVNLLSNSTDPMFFSSLFGSALGSVDWNNFGRLVQISRALYTRTSPLWSKSWDPKTLRNDLSNLDAQELKVYLYTDTVVPAITSQIGNLLKTPRPPEVILDLSATHFRSGDWAGVDLAGANIEGANLNYLTLAGANLSGVTRFFGASFYRSSWWEARSMSKALFEYLQKEWPHDPQTEYGPKGTKVSTSAYEAALEQLKRRLD
jgi:hypothetical protein